MTEKRRGLGRGLGALIPAAPAPAKSGADRPVDVFFPERTDSDAEAPSTPVTMRDGGAVEGLKPSTDNDVSRGTGDGAANGAAGVAAPAVSTQSATSSTNGSRFGEAELVPVPGARFAELPVESITPNPRQPRTVFEEDALAELVHSVREIGVLQPIVVRSAEPVDGQPRYELIMGERRWRATREAGLDRIPAIVRDTSDDAMLRDALLENLHRAELNPLEEAAAYQQLLDDFGCTHEELASRIGRSRPQISNTIRLLRLPPAVQR
jgi:ParB family transcriptional regulator, chromosome partitioning protein